MLVISFIAFAAQSSMGDPVSEMVAITASAEDKAAKREELGLNDPFLEQYGRFLGNVVQGDFGTSYFFKEPTTEVILRKLPATLELVFVAGLIVLLLSVPLGVYSAIRPKSILSKIIMGVSTVGISVPVFLTAIVLIEIFAVRLNWLPSSMRRYTTSPFGWESSLFNWEGFSYLIMPALALSSIMLPLFIRLIRSEMLEALSAEYIRFAKAKGLKDKVIWYKHALKNTLLPVITVGGVQVGMMIAYTLLTETVFQWPGVGFMFLEAINRADIPLLTTYIIFVGLLFVIINTVIDIVYQLIDPTVSVVGNN